MLFVDRLCDATLRKKSRLVVGLDPILDLIPAELLPSGDRYDREAASSAVEQFQIAVLDAVADYAVAVKPQMAFYERLGPRGLAALENVVSLANDRGLLVICDCKRGDIGSTAVAYADYYLGSREAGDHLPGLGADSVTVNPYLGADSLAPFAAHIKRGCGLFILAKTSNPGSADLQDRLIEGETSMPLYQSVATLADSIADQYPLGEYGYSSIGLVVGATFPQQAVALRQAFPRLPFLIPGVGTQGGKVQDIRDCFDGRGLGAVINASRSILFAYRENGAPTNWKDAARRAAAAQRDEINQALNLS